MGAITYWLLISIRSYLAPLYKLPGAVYHTDLAGGAADPAAVGGGDGVALQGDGDSLIPPLVAVRWRPGSI